MNNYILSAVCFLGIIYSMYEAITEKTEEIRQLLDRYDQADLAASEDTAQQLAKLDSCGPGNNPALEQYLSERTAVAKDSARSKAILQILGTGNMPKKAAADMAAEDPQFPALFDKFFKSSREFQRLCGISCAADLSGTERERYEQIFIKDFAPQAVKQRSHLKNQIKKACHELADLIDIRGLVRESRSAVIGAMEADIERFFRTTDVTVHNLTTINTRNFDSYVSSFVSRGQGTLHFFHARSIVFEGGIKPLDYVMGVVLKNADQHLLDGISFLVEVDRRQGTKYVNWLTQAVEGKKSVGNAELAQVADKFTRERIVQLLSENPTYSSIFELNRVRIAREARVKRGLLDAIPRSYPELFPLARAMFRHFVLHIGPTNSGKSYDAIEALKHADSGIYLAPLRLLAYEKYEELNEAGCLCSLKTGEEQVYVRDARLQSSTIEMLDFMKQYEVAVIDEAQMIADPQRGSSWTMAILGVQARTIHVCLAPEAEEAVCAMINACDDTYEIVRHKRFVPLHYEEDSPVVFPTRVERGTAFIVFTRRDVHAVAGELQRAGYRCSVIYGALPYDVRRNEVKRYMAGETDIVVATDAIGMGLNLPIKRIVFLRVWKFDGIEKRELVPTEIKQIAGRAGRYGMFDEGLVSSEEDPRLVRRSLDAVLPQIKEARIGFPFSLIGIDGTASQLMKKWCEIEPKPGFEVADLSREIGLAEELERESDDKTLVYTFVMFPFDDKNRELKDIWYKLFRTENRGRKRRFMEYLPAEPDEGVSLEQLELEFKICDLLYHYADAFVEKGTGALQEISIRKNQISETIMEKLSNERLKMRSCRICGRPLPFHNKYDICPRCYRERK